MISYPHHPSHLTTYIGELHRIGDSDKSILKLESCGLRVSSRPASIGVLCRLVEEALPISVLIRDGELEDIQSDRQLLLALTVEVGIREAGS